MMKKACIALVIVLALCFVVGCATKYIKIQAPDKVYNAGKPIFSVNPGDELQILMTKTCRGGSGTCYQVRNVKTGQVGFVSEKQIKGVHEVYTK